MLMSKKHVVSTLIDRFRFGGLKVLFIRPDSGSQENAIDLMR